MRERVYFSASVHERKKERKTYIARALWAEIYKLGTPLSRSEIIQ